MKLQRHSWCIAIHWCCSKVWSQMLNCSFQQLKLQVQTHRCSFTESCFLRNSRSWVYLRAGERLPRKLPGLVAAACRSAAFCTTGCSITEFTHVFSFLDLWRASNENLYSLHCLHMAPRSFPPPPFLLRLQSRRVRCVLCQIWLLAVTRYYNLLQVGCNNYFL